MEVSGKIHASAALCRGKIVPNVHWLGGWVGTRAGMETVKRKILPLPGIGSQSVARRYTD
jgi:hypothetical protein